jgi:hypothetical protein
MPCGTMAGTHFIHHIAWSIACSRSEKINITSTAAPSKQGDPVASLEELGVIHGWFESQPRRPAES